MAKPRKPSMRQKLPESKEAAAAVALTGAAAIGGKLALEKVSADRRTDVARPYRLGRAEFVPDGMRRIARGQLDAGIDELAGQPNRGLDEAVHETRKRLKRLRAALRLERSAIGAETYRRENAAFRDLGKRLSAPRCDGADRDARRTDRPFP